MLNNLRFFIQVSYAEYNGSGSFGTFSNPKDVMYSSRLTPGDPYSFSASHTPTPEPYLYSAGHSSDPTAFGAVQTPPAACGAVQTHQIEFGAGKIPDHTALGFVRTSNSTPDQTAIRYTAGFSATASTPPTAAGAVRTGQPAFGVCKIPDHTALGDVQTKNPTPDQTAIRYTSGFSATFLLHQLPSELFRSDCVWSQ